MKAIDNNGGAPHGHCAKHDRAIEALEARADAHDTSDGEILAILDKTYRAATLAANEATAVRGELKDERERRQRECDIRHEGVSARLVRVENHDDFEDKSGVTYAPDILALRYDERGVELAKAKAKTRQAMWIALPSIVIAVATVAGTILAMFAK